MPRLTNEQFAHIGNIVWAYDNDMAAYNNILTDTPNKSGIPGRASEPGNPTAAKAERRANIAKRLDAIDRALKLLPRGVRPYVFDNARYGNKWPTLLPASVWRQYKEEFFFNIAENIGVI